MELKRSIAAVPTLTILDTVGSTNDALAELAARGDAAHLATILTLDQTAGRGRLGRSWIAPAGKALAISVYLKPALPSGRALGIDRFAWLPLIAGAAMSRSVDALVGNGRTGLKWPNDIQVDGLKVCGVLTELLPTADSVVVGAGVNLTLERDELPVSGTTSLSLSGASAAGEELVDLVASGYLTALAELLQSLTAAGGDAIESGVHRTVSEWCRTIGREVRVSLPGGEDLLGVATGIDETGRLLVREPVDGRIRSVAAGDVTHLRYE